MSPSPSSWQGALKRYVDAFDVALAAFDAAALEGNPRALEAATTQLRVEAFMLATAVRSFVKQEADNVAHA